MAYRIEEEEDGTQALIIDGWTSGIAPDPYSGTGRMRSVNLNVPGEISVGYPITANVISGATLGTPIADSTRFFLNYTDVNPAGFAKEFAILDTNGRVFSATSISGTWTFLSSGESHTGATAGDGLVFWLGYLFKTRGTAIDYWDGSTWHNSWNSGGGESLSASASNFPHFMYVGTDNVLYITNQEFVASITLTNPSDPSSFDPTSSGTYTISPSKLLLPVTDMAVSLAEIGLGSSSKSTLLIGGQQNAIYPWDKTSASFGLPIWVADSFIKLLVSVNQNVFIFAGNQQGRGRIYITNGSQADLYFKIPDYLFGQNDPYFVWGDAIFHRNNLIFGFFPQANDQGGPLTSDNIWALDLNTKAFRSISRLFLISGKANATALISTGSIASAGFGFIVGWNNNNVSAGIGYSGTTAGIGSGDIRTEQIPVGTFTTKKTFTQVEYKLRSPLESGENISITAIADNDSQVLTFSPTPAVGSISGYASLPIQGSQWLQFDITLVGNSATSGVRLKELRLR